MILFVLGTLGITMAPTLQNQVAESIAVSGLMVVVAFVLCFRKT
jgi:hypothetical protein